MGKIVISENVSLDGVIEDPTGAEGFSAAAGSGRPIAATDGEKVTLDKALGTEALLLGRRSYEFFAAHVAIPERRVGGQDEQRAQVRRVLDPRGPRLEQLDGR